jgi:hypothetical protein
MEKLIVIIVIYRNQVNLLKLNKKQLSKYLNVNHVIPVRRRDLFSYIKYIILAPEITLPPVSVSNKTGSNVFLTCEVAGVPLPVVEWIFTSTTGKQVVYPSKII